MKRQRRNRRPPSPSMVDAVEWILDRIEAHVRGPVLVFGSLPPEGRDLDLLVRGTEEGALTDGFARDGLERRGHRWAVFRNCSAYRVEVVAASAWGLPEVELEALFGQARPLEGRQRVARPAPHHSLLILARRIAFGGGLGEKHRSRVASALAEDPSAWDVARERATAWGVERALDSMRTAFEGGAELPAGNGHGRRRRGHVVALSGVDGSGKSAQSWGLIEALERTGIPAAVEHVPLGSDRVLWVVGGLAHQFVRRTARYGVFADAARRTEAGASILGDPGNPAPSGGRTHVLLTQAWATFVAVANALTHWRTASRHLVAGRVVIHDRYVLDSVVRLRTLYGETRSFRLQRWLLRRLSPQPLCAFLLDVPPETAFARKQDRWAIDQLARQVDLYRAEREGLGIMLVDGARPQEEICAEIAAEVWRRLDS
jgi:thymidylate kinase